MLIGRAVFRSAFPRGAEITYDAAFRAIRTIPSAYIHWFLLTYISGKVSRDYLRMKDRSTDRLFFYGLNKSEEEDKRLAKWLYKTVRNHFEGGDVSIKK